MRPRPASDHFWVFGYGSLMWNPGFEHLERRKAVLPGYRRDFALQSVRYRGTPDSPGLVLGLDHAPGESCTGIAFRVCRSREAEVRAYLHAREMVTRSYFEVACPVTLLCEGELRGDPVEATAYVLDRTHPQYAGGLGPERQAEIIATAEGPAGSNADYLHNTVAHLAEIGVDDPWLVYLDRMVRQRRR